MFSVEQPGTFGLGDLPVKRLGYGAMRLSGPGIFGPPKDRDTALAVLREAVASGVNHIDTSDYYGPHITNQLIREALYPPLRDRRDRCRPENRCRPPRTGDTQSHVRKGAELRRHP
jgi:aryl-alcohol dehydrogenase-like predicted oxidoreductase